MNTSSSSDTGTLRHFFFAEEAPFGMALVRIFFPLAAAIPMVMRAPRVRELFSSDGATAQLPLMSGWGNVLPVFSPGIAIPLYGVMLACILLTVVGFRTRLSLLVCTPLYVYFNLIDAVSTLTKYSVISSHLFVLLAVSNCGAVWSVDSFLAGRRGRNMIVPPKHAVWPARLVQLLFAFVYFGAAITKMQTSGFFSGAQLRYWMLTNWNYGNPIGEMMAMWTPVLLVGAYLTMLWEMLFCVLVWQRRLRIPTLMLGVAFHLLTSVMLGLFVFPAICLAGYLAFVTERDVVYVRRVLRRLRLRSPVNWPTRAAEVLLPRFPRALPAGVTWLCLVGVAAIGLVELEVQSDLYGMESSEQGLQLQPVDRAVAQAMIRNERRVREKDKFFDFAIGTYMVGRQLANRADEFTYGDRILAQCNLNPPHEDLWVECLVQDSDGRTIEQFGQFVTREMMWADFTYHLGNKLLPGEYSMVLKSANQEIARRRFTLSGTWEETGSDVLTN